LARGTGCAATVAAGDEQVNIQGPAHVGISKVHGPHGVNAPHAPFRSRQATDAAKTQATGDRVEISPAAEAAISAAEAKGVRHELVNRIRSEIAAGTYETPEKLDAAIEQMLDRLT
jgi:negative regulator of flagellin synthesis FlgM